MSPPGASLPFVKATEWRTPDAEAFSHRVSKRFQATESNHSHVRRFKLQAQNICCSRSSVLRWPLLGRARDTIMKTTVDHALIRGLVTAGPVMRRGASSV